MVARRASSERDASACALRGRRGDPSSRVRDGRVVARGLVGARRDAGCRVRLLDGGLLDVLRIPVLVVALWSLGSTAGSRGVAARSIGSGRRSAGVRRSGRGGDSTPQSRTGAAGTAYLGPRPPEKLGPRKRPDQVHVNATCQRDHRIKPSRREKHWVSDARTGVAHPPTDIRYPCVVRPSGRPGDDRVFIAVYLNCPPRDARLSVSPVWRPPLLDRCWARQQTRSSCPDG